MFLASERVGVNRRHLLLVKFKTDLDAAAPDWT